MTELIKNIITSLTSKIGGVGGMIVSYVLQFFGAKLADYLNDLYKKFKRKQEQEATLVKVEADIKAQSPRTEEVKKHELDNLNS